VYKTLQNVKTYRDYSRARCTVERNLTINQHTNLVNYWGQNVLSTLPFQHCVGECLHWPCHSDTFGSRWVAKGAKNEMLQKGVMFFIHVYRHLYNLHKNMFLTFLVFLPCDAVCTVSVIVILSVRPSVHLSVCLSHSWTVSTWFDLRSWFLHHRVAPSF